MSGASVPRSRPRLLLTLYCHDRAAVQAFCGSIHCGGGGNVSLAVGPVGRQADANMRLGRSGTAVCYSYSCSRGAYAGELAAALTYALTDAQLHEYQGIGT